MSLPPPRRIPQSVTGDAELWDFTNRLIDSVYFMWEFQKKFQNIPVYVDNASAIAGGLSVGSFYRTGADPDVICVVH